MPARPESAVAEPDERSVDLQRQNSRLSQRVRTLTEHLTQIKGELAQAHARVVALTTTDDATGLLTWRGFAERAQTEIARAARYQREIGLVVFAPAEPDARVLAEICRSQHRDSDLAGHTERGEIVLLLPETSLQGALVIAQRIRAQVAKARGGAVTMGCASYPQHGRTLSVLLSTARSAV